MVVSGPPFHPNCKCTLTQDDIDNAETHESALSGYIGPNANTNLRDAKWLKEALCKMCFYKPNKRAGETADGLNTYPNQNLFDALEQFQSAYELPICPVIKPGNWEEVLLTQELEKYKDIEIPEIKEGLLELNYYKPDKKNGESADNLSPTPSIRLNRSIARFQRDNNIDTMEDTMEQIREHLAQLGGSNEAQSQNENNITSIQSRIVRRTMAEEGGYVDDPRLIDQPTNAGIVPDTLNAYNTRHPEAGFPTAVGGLSGEQAEQIYDEMYYSEHRIGEIGNPQVAYAVYDMGVMSKFQNVGRIIQNTINETLGINLVVDGIVGSGTIRALNNIPDDQLHNFMSNLVENRLEYLQGLEDWPQFGNGWRNRTNRYLQNFD